MQLPDALLPWREWLEWFDPHTWPGFTDLLGRIDPLLGPLRGLQLGGEPEPDGLSDLQRRGPYERLLTSEWLLADELPDEFLRRAATGEHLFLAPEQRARQANRRVVVLFDAGPLQWGAPRLVHLALMILLARRAREAGGDLQWGIVQQPGVLADMASAVALKRLLQARTEQPAEPSHWQAWQAFMAEQAEPAGECWVVGARHGADAMAAPFSHRVNVQRTLDGRHLQFELHGTRHQRLLLPLPDRKAGERLLNGQFEALTPSGLAPSKSWRVGLTFAPVISYTGSHVALMLLDEPGSLVFRMPPAQQTKPAAGRKQLWHRGLKPVAATFLSNRFAAVLSDAGRLQFWKMAPLRVINASQRERFLAPSGTASLLPCVWLMEGNQPRLYCLDKQGELAYWALNAARETELTTMDSNVLGLARVGQESLAYLKKEGLRLFLSLRDSRGQGRERFVLGSADNIIEVLFAGSQGRRSQFVPCGIKRRGDTGDSWYIHNRADDPSYAQVIHLTASHQPIGLLHDNKTEQSSLLLLGADKHSISVYCESRFEALFTTTAAIQRHTFCAVSGMLAVLTASRELLVYSLHERRMRLQVMCNDAAMESPEYAR